MDNGEEEHITDKGVNVEETNERVTSMPSNTNVGEQVTDEGVNTEENNKRAKSTSSNFNQPLSNDDVSLFGSNCLHKLKTGGSFLEVMDEIVKVGQTMGYNMEGVGHKTKKDWIKELCMKRRVNFVALQETKTESMDLVTIKALWGNLPFDYAFSPSVGNSR
ncbi:RNA-directed DNA polymerase, eukaryota, partial [Tanacetum coccineum]